MNWIAGPSCRNVLSVAEFSQNRPLFVFWDGPSTIRVTIGFVIGIAVAVVWTIVWTIILRAYGIPVFKRSPQQYESLRQRFLRMGQARYIIIQGILGPGVASGLAIAVADLVSRPSEGWIEAVFKLVFFAVIVGLWSGFDGWVKLRGAVPFPPE